jgi:hypothetical protein
MYKNLRTYNCKDEELPILCIYFIFILKKDWIKFNAFSQKYNEGYLTDFEGKVYLVSDLVSPKLEIAELKVITARLYKAINGLNDSANYLKMYVKMAKTDVPYSLTDFGLTLLRKKAGTKDAEGVLSALKVVNANIQQFKTPLMEQGLTEKFITNLKNTAAAIQADNQKQFEITRQRKELVQENVGMLNGLYDQMTELLNVGKILFKGQPLKLQEYTFSELKKSVRQTASQTKSAVSTETNV